MGARSRILPRRRAETMSGRDGEAPQRGRHLQPGPPKRRTRRFLTRPSSGAGVARMYQTNPAVPEFQKSIGEPIAGMRGYSRLKRPKWHHNGNIGLFSIVYVY